MATSPMEEVTTQVILAETVALPLGTMATVAMEALPLEVGPQHANFKFFEAYHSIAEHRLPQTALT